MDSTFATGSHSVFPMSLLSAAGFMSSCLVEMNSDRVRRPTAVRTKGLPGLLDSSCKGLEDGVASPEFVPITCRSQHGAVSAALWRTVGVGSRWPLRRNNRPCFRVS